MNTIWKYQVALSAEPTVLMVPPPAQFLAAGWQGMPVVWFLADPDEMPPKVPITVRVVGTGWDVPDDATHLATVHNPPYVWHLFTEPTI